MKATYYMIKREIDGLYYAGKNEFVKLPENALWYGPDSAHGDKSAAENSIAVLDQSFTYILEEITEEDTNDDMDCTEPQEWLFQFKIFKQDGGYAAIKDFKIVEDAAIQCGAQAQYKAEALMLEEMEANWSDCTFELINII